MRYILDLYFSRIYDKRTYDSALFTLCQFTRYEEMSATQIYNILKSTQYESANKNTLEKIKRFEKNKLIKKTKTIDREHNSKYYRLTRSGIFFIFYKLHGKTQLIQGRVKSIITGLIKNYGDDEFFNFYVYPYIKKSTLLELQSSTILEFLLNYFTEIAHKTVSILFEMAVIENYSGNKNSLKSKKYEYLKKKQVISFFTNLKQKMDLENEEDWDKIPHYTEGIDSLNDNLVSELVIDRDNIFGKNLIFPIIGEGNFMPNIMNKDKQSNYKSVPIKRWLSIEEDVILLVKDEIFSKRLESTKNGFENCYNNIIKLKHRTIKM